MDISYEKLTKLVDKMILEIDEIDNRNSLYKSFEDTHTANMVRLEQKAILYKLLLKLYTTL